MGQPEKREGFLAVKPTMWRIGLVGCVVILIFVLIALSAIIFFVGRTPYYRDLVECHSRIQRIGDAVGRYATKNDDYPKSLKDLVPDYIPAAALKCPADKSAGAVSYIYRIPKPNDPSDFHILECRHHQLRKDIQPGGWAYQKNGQVVPLMQEPLKLKP